MAAEKRDYYEVLGISKDADETAIKKAYRVLAKKYHPDANPGDKEAEAKFKEASEAYAILIDPEKRKQYDQFGHAAFDGTGGAGGFDFNGAGMGDIFGDIFGDLFGGGGFGGFGGFGGSRRADAPQKGESTRTSIRISFKEAVTGTEKEIQINLKESCPECGGSGCKSGTSPVTCTHCNGAGRVTVTQQTLFGTMQSQRVCPHCNGSGKIIKDKCGKCYGSGFVSRRKPVAVSIPAGIDDGQSIRIRGKGEPGRNGGEWGDLLVEVRVSSDPVFEREDTTIFSTVAISFPQAALGDTIQIETVDGPVEYSVRPGTQPGTRIRLRGKGVPYLRSQSMRGDHIVTLDVKVPEKLSAKQKEALIAFDEAMDGSLNGKKKKGLFK